MPTVPADATQLLFICSQNRWRSLTAERLFDGHPHCEARSAGTEPGARVRVTAGHLGWADVVFVMERKHADILQAKFGAELAGKPLINLRIPDKFQFLDAVLQDLLRERLAEHLPPSRLSPLDARNKREGELALVLGASSPRPPSPEEKGEPDGFLVLELAISFPSLLERGLGGEVPPSCATV